MREDAVLDRIEALAGEGGEASSDAVLDLMVELLVDRGEALRPEFRETWCDLFLVVWRRASPSACRDAAERLARQKEVPEALLRAIAREPVDVSAPVLEEAPVSTDDLLSIATEATPAHLRAIARRNRLPESVADRIVLRGDREAILILLLNRRAGLPMAQLPALLDAAAGETALRDALIQRPDLAAAAADRLWPILDPGGRARLIAGGWRYGKAEIDEVRREAAAALISSVRSGSLPQGIDTCLALVGEGRLTMAEGLAEFITAGRLVEAGQLIARIGDMAEGLAINLLYGRHDRGLAILARFSGLDIDTLAQLACARGLIPSLQDSDVHRALRAYEEIGDKEVGAIMEVLAALWAAGVADGGSRRRLRSAEAHR